ncbi:lysylphosphatidylglycerol synthase domain-containing protein [Nocardioides sp.]|uniref:lysylphosphatidylglycerol synthase domain-containing protein n=1 Tax=Nocardioides sp. TaxID=35761 RepID=UPI003526F252
MSVAQPVTARGSRRPGVRVRWRYVGGILLAVALLAFALPSVSGVSLRAVQAVVSSLPARALAALLVLWIGGLLLHTLTLTAALPRLTHRRALTLSLTGSAVANVLPLGGAAGVALNYRMVRTWGFTRQQFATYTVVTNVWDVLAKLVLVVVALPLLALTSSVVTGQWFHAVLTLAAVVALVLGVAVAVLASPVAAGRLGRLLDVALARLGRDTDLETALVELQQGCSRVVRASWLRLSLGVGLYAASLGLLLGACLWLTGAGVSPVVVLVGLAVERMLTLAGLTPGGAGIVELGLTGVLLVLGGDPAGVVAGVLLYRAITFGLEIPVGGAGVAAWLWARRRAGEPVEDLEAELQEAA